MRDAGLCHGAAGLAHLFNRIHQATGDAVLGDAARRAVWCWRSTCTTRGSGWAAFLGSDPLDRRGPQWVADPGILMGSTGIGLALLAATGTVELAWDRILMLSIR